MPHHPKASVDTSAPKPTEGMRISPDAKGRMRTIERAEYRYYNDMGANRGHCTWGVGILAHRGVCTPEELARPVSVAQVNAEYDRRVAEAEAAVHRNVHVALNQAQFDGLVSFTFNAGADGAGQTFQLLNNGDFKGAGANMKKFIRVKVKTKKGTQKVVARGLVARRAQESAPFMNGDTSANTASK